MRICRSRRECVNASRHATTAAPRISLQLSLSGRDASSRESDLALCTIMLDYANAQQLYALFS